MEPMSKFCDPTINVYKISWNLLVGGSGFNRGSDYSANPSTASVSSAEDVLKQSFDSCCTDSSSQLVQEYHSQSSQNDFFGLPESP